MFVKYGDGKIVSVLDEENLTEEQKKAVKDASQDIIKQSKNEPDTSSEVKNSGR